MKKLLPIYYFNILKIYSTFCSVIKIHDELGEGMMGHCYDIKMCKIILENRSVIFYTIFYKNNIMKL